ncbi:NADP-dependent oxidoreductase [Companilactobacillus keshanensis]|nr:NADP-dependent oxidoreductase [Companilactobacillus keshanensis]
MNDYGDSSVLEEKLVQVPDLKASEVLIEVLGTSVSPFDIGMRRGNFRERMPIQFPAVLGTDAVGRIVATGTEVTDYQIGEIVLGIVGNTKLGAYSDMAILDAKTIARLPHGVALDQGTVTMVGVPAYLALFDNGHLQAGQSVLIHGGAGGVGTLAIQLAKQAGATVYTTANLKDASRLEALGADKVIDYNTDFRNQVANLDLVIDTVGGEVLRHSFDVVKPGGRLVTLVEHLSTDLTTQYPQVQAQFLSAQGTGTLAKILDLIASDKLHVPIQKTFPLTRDGIANAQDYLENNHVFGRVAILKQ